MSFYELKDTPIEKLLDMIADHEVGRLSDFSDTMLERECESRGLCDEVQSCKIEDFSTNALLDEIDVRGDADELDRPRLTEARKLVQKHRCGQDVSKEAIELLYDMVNKIV